VAPHEILQSVVAEAVGANAQVRVDEGTAVVIAHMALNFKVTEVWPRGFDLSLQNMPKVPQQKGTRIVNRTNPRSIIVLIAFLISAFGCQQQSPALDEVESHHWLSADRWLGSTQLGS
jgi:hypothetical protein